LKRESQTAILEGVEKSQVVSNRFHTLFLRDGKNVRDAEENKDISPKLDGDGEGGRTSQG
jgi:hypothetical protein